VTITIYHNPACGTSRNVLAQIRASGREPVIIQYLKTPPGRDELQGLIARMGIGVRDLLRRKGTPYDELGLDDPALTDEQLLDAIDGASHPDQPPDRGHCARREIMPAGRYRARHTAGRLRTLRQPPETHSRHGPKSWMTVPSTVATPRGDRRVGVPGRRWHYTRIGISTYSALESPASCTTVGADPSAKRNSTCSGI
jgi:arsenate reductase (glutaredoxin)